MWKEHRLREPPRSTGLSLLQGSLQAPSLCLRSPWLLLSPAPQTQTQAWFPSIRLRGGSPESLVLLTRQTARAESGDHARVQAQKVNRVRKQTSCGAVAAESPGTLKPSRLSSGTPSLTL